MPVKIEITGADAHESIRELAALAAAMNGQSVAPAQTAVQQEEQEEPEEPGKQPRKRKAQQETATGKGSPDDTPPQQKTEDSQSSDDVQNETADDQIEQTDEQTDDQTGESGGPNANDDEPVPTIEELRALAASLGKAKVKPLLEEFGAKGLSELPLERRFEFLKRMGEMAE